MNLFERNSSFSGMTSCKYWKVIPQFVPLNSLHASILNFCPHSVYHSGMQLQPATDRTWQVSLGYFFGYEARVTYWVKQTVQKYDTGWNSTPHSITLLLAVTPNENNRQMIARTGANDSLEIHSWLYCCIAGWSSLVKSPDRWSLFQSALLLGSLCSI